MINDKIKSRNSVKWLGISQVGKVLMQLVSIFVLARILPAEDFGLMALAGTAIAFAGLIRDMGTGSALIQKDVLSHDLKNAVFIFNVLIGIALTGVIMALSPLLAVLFRESRLTNTLLFLAPVFTIISLGAVHQALLERDSLFKSIALIELVSGFCGLVSALIFAWLGGGVNALIAQSIVSAIVGTLFLWILSSWRPVFNVNFSALKDIYKFSGNIFIFSLTNYFQRNADSMLIGRLLGVTELGFYNIAYRFLLFPLQNLTFVISRATFPTYSRNQHSPALIGKHYLDMLGIIAFITAPLMALIWALREPLVYVLLGERWIPAAAVLFWLTPVGFFQSITSTSGSVLNSIGRSDVLRNLGYIGVPFLTASFIIGLPWGINGVAAGYCIANLIWVYPLMKTVLKLVSCTFREFIFVIIRPVLIAIMVALMLSVINDFVVEKYHSNLLSLFCCTFIGIVFYSILSFIFMRNSFFKFIYLITNRS